MERKEEATPGWSLLEIESTIVYNWAPLSPKELLFSYQNLGSVMEPPFEKMSLKGKSRSTTKKTHPQPSIGRFSSGPAIP